MRINAVNSAVTKEPLKVAVQDQKAFLANSLPDQFSRLTGAIEPKVSFNSNGQKQIEMVSFGAKRIKADKIRKVVQEARQESNKIFAAIQMKVSGVTKFQDNMDPEKMKFHKTLSVNRLADGLWKDGDEVKFKISNSFRGKMIELSSAKFGRIGRVPDEISPNLVEMLERAPKDFKFELSNVIAGNTPGAPTIGLRVNLKCVDAHSAKDAQKAFNTILNDPNASKKTFLYQESVSPREVLQKIYANLKKEHGAKGDLMIQQTEKTLSSIVKELESPENKKILFIGHCKPDGDTLGSVNGLSSVVKMLFPEKMIDCAVADEIPGLFRKNLPGVEKMKHPYSAEQVKNLENKLAKAVAENAGEHEIKTIQESLNMAKDPNLLMDPKQKYDAVVLMDIPSPARFTNAFKTWVAGAKTAMYVDHHPLELAKWDSVKGETGVDMKKIFQNNLAWVADQVAAAAQQSVIIASKLLPEKNPLNPDNFIRTANSKNLGIDTSKLDNAVKSWVTGIWTDTSGFSRTANLLTKDVKDAHGNPVPVQNRPNYLPEGMSKWLFSLTDGRVDKKWFRDNIKFILEHRDDMLQISVKNRKMNPEIGFGYTKATFDDLNKILEKAQIEDSSTNFSDVVNEFKLSEVMSGIKTSEKQKVAGGANVNPLLKNIVDEVGPYDEEKIAVFACESEKMGHLNTEGKISDMNALRFSFRSADGTPHAEFLANLFNGGGHGPAAGGHFRSKTVNLDSTFAVKVNGQKVQNEKDLYKALEHNFDLRHDVNLSEEQIQDKLHKIELFEDPQGDNAFKLMEKVVTEIRANEATKMPAV